MPRIVESLTPAEQEAEKKVRQRFSEEQMCAYFLSKTIRSLYQFPDDFVVGWYQEMFDKKPDEKENMRRELVSAYTRMLMFENKYRFHLDYWLRQYQDGFIAEMETFFSGEPGKK